MEDIFYGKKYQSIDQCFDILTLCTRVCKICNLVILFHVVSPIVILWNLEYHNSPSNLLVMLTNKTKRHLGTLGTLISTIAKLHKR